MNQGFGFPPPPNMNPGQNVQYATDIYGNKIPVMVVPSQPQPVQEVIPQQQMNFNNYSGTGISFGGLMNPNAVVPMVTEINENAPEVSIIDGSGKKRKSSKKKDSDKPVSSAEIVNNTVYSESYDATNEMLARTIAQVDELACNIKAELDAVRSAKALKGRYLYMTNMSSSLATLLSTKINAIKEINNSIKISNDAEYRRFKDNRAIEAQDDSKYIMDMYKAYTSIPVGSLPQSSIQYNKPPSMVDMTVSSLGKQPDASDIFKADIVGGLTAGDSGFVNFMNNLTPEQNAMINEGNPNIKEVIVYDEATGRKYFDWMDYSTNKRVPNMPIKDSSLMEDFVIDPKTRTARNINMGISMPVIYQNEGAFNNY